MDCDTFSTVEAMIRRYHITDNMDVRKHVVDVPYPHQINHLLIMQL